MTYDASGWKPGDVAVISVPKSAARGFPIGATGFTTLHAARYNGGWAALADADYYWPDSYEHFGMPPRPLVVIDPEDAEQVERLCDALYGGHAGGVAPKVKHALREFARPTPRIEEPTGLGAVVEDAGGQRFVRMHDGWWRSDEPCTVNWAAIDAVRVASPGVTP